MFGKYVITQHCPEFKNDDQDDHIWKKQKQKVYMEISVPPQ